jgi:hypothetical protein
MFVGLFWILDWFIGQVVNEIGQFKFLITKTSSNHTYLVNGIQSDELHKEV